MVSFIVSIDELCPRSYLICLMPAVDSFFFLIFVKSSVLVDFIRTTIGYFFALPLLYSYISLSGKACLWICVGWFGVGIRG